MGTMIAINERRNLKPWKPGRSGNLNGRLIGKSMIRGKNRIAQRSSAQFKDLFADSWGGQLSPVGADFIYYGVEADDGRQLQLRRPACVTDRSAERFGKSRA